MSLSLVPTYGAWLTVCGDNFGNVSMELDSFKSGFISSGGPKTIVRSSWQFFETAQITFFFRSTLFRLVLRFGEIREDLFCAIKELEVRGRVLEAKQRGEAKMDEGRERWHDTPGSIRLP
ncbi:hypothetical protein B0H11DRAFT_1941791 [Mycena galericulata]|nr:hypothetical protein B0H11DRAFT_1941791 [Mycena galericulata]